MLTNGHITEQAFQEFLKAGYGDKVRELHPIQKQEIRRAFYGGLSAACFMQQRRQLIIEECQHFFETEVKNHIKSMISEDSNE